ncbi:MAG: response regulator, partial [Phormidesmis sp.]
LEEEIVVRKQAEAQSLKAKEAAEVASQAKSEFLANMSHELRSPLNAILGFAQLMKNSNTLSAEHHDNSSVISRSGEHLLNMINDVLDMSKIEAGYVTYTPVEFDLYRLLDDLRNMFHLRAAQKHILLDFQYADSLPTYVSTDQNKLRQVLINLLNNAIKFTEAGSVILQAAMRFKVSSEVSPQASEGSEDTAVILSFKVIDTGCGLEADDIDQAFEPFVQTESGRNASEGTGLGLPISQKFVQMMGGDITIASAGCKQGTTVAFTIAAQVIDSLEPNVRSPERRILGLAPGQSQRRLLIVDDKSDNRKLLRKLLEPLGFELQEAQNGREAVEISLRWQPHLIWMDMRMPVMDGYKATAQIKESAIAQPPKIIALSASSFKEEQATALRAGCDDFVQKPLHASRIFEAMSQHLGVRYLYYSEHHSEHPSNQSLSTDSLLLDSKRLLALPPQLLEDLKQATLRLQWNRILQLIEQIQAHDEPLGEAIASTVHSFHYAHILQAIQAAGDAANTAVQETPS